MATNEVHNKLTEIATDILVGIKSAGGSHTDVLVLLESVIAGVPVMIIKEDAVEKGADGIVVDILAKCVKDRMKTIRAARADERG